MWNVSCTGLAIVDGKATIEINEMWAMSHLQSLNCEWLQGPRKIPFTHCPLSPTENTARQGTPLRQVRESWSCRSSGTAPLPQAPECPPQALLNHSTHPQLRSFLSSGSGRRVSVLKSLRPHETISVFSRKSWSSAVRTVLEFSPLGVKTLLCCLLITLFLEKCNSGKEASLGSEAPWAISPQKGKVMCPQRLWP